jgi:plasmid stabilization system protein ParE
MSWRVSLKPPARAEYDEALDWFGQNLPTKRDAFESAVEAVFTSLATNPLKHQIVQGDVRKAVVQKFPYVVYYTVARKTVYVISVFNAKRDPAIWQSRI